MRIVVDANKLIKTIIGNQRINNTQYRPMKYILRIELEDGLLLHNVITGQLVLLEDWETIILEQLPSKPVKNMEQLISSYFFVPIEFDEKKFVDGYRRILQQIERNKKTPITKYTIFPTTCCNAHCFYCFEAEFEKINMDESTALKVAEFIHLNSGNKRVELNWFGGEPTVAADRIDDICKSLRERNVGFISGMVSNGYLLDKKMASKAVNDWNLKSIQITLDGTEEIYNQTKKFSVLGSAYKRVLDNITVLLELGVTVTVLLNLDRHNYDDLFKLVDDLSKRYRMYKNFKVASHILFNNEGYEKVYHTKKEEEILIKQNHRLGEYMKKVGLNGNIMGDVLVRGKLPQMRHMYCMANDSSAIVIGPNGNLFKCEHIEDSLESSASIDKGIISKKELDEWFEPFESKECLDCCLYPDCFIPVHCKDRTTPYPIDCEKRIESYKVIAQNKYYNVTNSEKGGETNEEV